MRNIEFATDELYHVYNRGTDKRAIILDKNDVERFFRTLKILNTIEPVGSLYENTFKKDTPNKDDELIEIIAYCLNPNHFHLLLKQKQDNGIIKFMQRFGTSFTKYFNHRHKRSGVLFQGKFKSIHVNDNEYLLHLSAYINLNDLAHQLGSSTSKLGYTSWNEYLSRSNDKLCSPDIILDQFKNTKEYEDFAYETLGMIRERKLLLLEFD